MANENLISGLGGVAGYGETTFSRADDGYFFADISSVFSDQIVLGTNLVDPADFGVSTNGYISISSLWIAPFPIDLDNTWSGTGRVHVDIDDTSDVVTVTWDRMGRYSEGNDPTISFQLQMALQDNGQILVSFRYGDMELTADDIYYFYGRPDIGISAGVFQQGSPFDTETIPADYDTIIGNSGEAGVWNYVIGAISGSGNDDDLEGSIYGDILYGLGGDDRLRGLQGDDLLEGGSGGDTLIGGLGLDTAQYRSAELGVTASLSDTGQNTGDAAGDSYNGIENLSGSLFDDILSGDGNANVMRGLRGADELQGLAGNDVLRGNNGRDILSGGAGDDVLAGGRGFDLLIGGAGADRLVGTYDYTSRFGLTDFASYQTSGSGVIVSAMDPSQNTGEAAGDSFFLIGGLIGSAYDDNLTGFDTVGWLRGGDGDDTLTGGSWVSRLAGQAGDDTLTGSIYRDVFIYDEGADTITNFGYGRDRLRLDDTLWDDAELTVAEIMDFAEIEGDDLVFRFGEGNSLRLQDFTDANAVEAVLGFF